MTLAITKLQQEKGFNTESYLIALFDIAPNTQIEIQFEHTLSFDPTWVEVVPVMLHGTEADGAPFLVEVNKVLGNLTYRYGTQNNNRTVYLYKPNPQAQITYYKVHLGRTHSTPQ